MVKVTVAQLAAVDTSTLTGDTAYSECGWYDWFCSDTALIRRSDKFVGLAKRIEKNWGQVGVFLKNCCPCNGPTYDALILQDTKGDNHYFIEKRNGMWNVYFVPDCKNNATPIFEASHVVALSKWLNDQQLPK